MSINPDGTFINDQVISALELPAEIYDQIVSIIRKESKLDCNVWTFMNKKPEKIYFQGLQILRLP